MSPKLQALFDGLDALHGSISVEALTERLSRLDVSMADVAQFARFAPDRYQRNLMHAGPSYEALLLCWQAGQRSPIHDHRGSHCAFRVLTGTAAETRFARTAQGLIFPLGTTDLPPGTICGTHDQDLHQVSNLQAAGTPLVTLHVYSPPLRVCNVFSLTERGSHEWVDPVFEFADGSGI